MTVTLYSGFLALGTGTTTFTEETGTGYARVAVALDHVSPNRTSNRAIATFTATGTNWGNVTQMGVYTASTAGILQLWWPLTQSHAVANTASYTVPAGALNLFFVDAIYRNGYISNWVLGDVLGHDAAGLTIQAGASLTVQSGVISSAAVNATSLGALDLSGLPTTDPTGGKVWLKVGNLHVGA